MTPLHPVVVQLLLDLMTEAEAFELDEYASAEPCTPESYFERANDWLYKRFPDVIANIEMRRKTVLN